MALGMQGQPAIWVIVLAEASLKIGGLAYICTARRVHQNVDVEFH
jgi:hypothetical protein